MGTIQQGSRGLLQQSESGSAGVQGCTAAHFLGHAPRLPGAVHHTATGPSTTATPDYLNYISPAQIAVQVLAVIVIMTATVAGNSLMCYAVYSRPCLRTVTNIYTLNLAVTDFGVGLFVLPMWVVSMILGAESTMAPFPHILCELNAFTTVTLLLVSIATLAGISLDRYFSICYPLRYPMEATSKRVYLSLGYMWLQSVLLASTPFFGWGEYRFRPQTIAICNPVWMNNMGHAAFMLTVGVGIPFIIILFSYTRIIQAARRQAKRIEQLQIKLANPWVNPGPIPATSTPKPTPTSSEQTPSSTANASGVFTKGGQWMDPHGGPVLHRWRVTPRTRRKQHRPPGNAVFSNISKNMKTLKTVFIVIGCTWTVFVYLHSLLEIGVFFVCWCPYVILNFWGVHHTSHGLPYTADLMTTLLAFSNSVTNPPVFMLLTRDFRYAVRHILANCCSGCRHCSKLVEYCTPDCKCQHCGCHCCSGRVVCTVETMRLQSQGVSYDSGLGTDSIHTTEPCRGMTT